MTQFRRPLLTAALLLPIALAGCSGASSAASPANSIAPSPSSSATPAATPGSGSGATSASPSSTPIDAGLGSLPSFLPSSSTGAVGHGSTDNPALSYPGAPVVVTTSQGDVRIEVDGPTYPGNTPIGATQIAATFTVTFTQASATIDLSAAHFDVYDHAGNLHKLAAAPALPASIAPGQSVTVKLTGTLPSGQGLLRYYPSGQVAASAWDYVAETD